MLSLANLTSDSDLAFKLETFLIHMVVRGQDDLFRAKLQGQQSSAHEPARLLCIP